jgi:hypothetical protein
MPVGIFKDPLLFLLSAISCNYFLELAKGVFFLSSTRVLGPAAEVIVDPFHNGEF